MLARPADEAGQWLVVSGASAAAAVAVAGVACVVVDAPPSLPREQGENARIGD
jgi:UDP-N-acetylglucosamine:LPS N-acetylglucosamine transferase